MGYIYIGSLVHRQPDFPVTSVYVVTGAWHFGNSLYAEGGYLAFESHSEHHPTRHWLACKLLDRMSDYCSSTMNSQPDPITFQQLFDHMTKVETDNAVLKDIVVAASLLPLKLCYQLNDAESKNQTLRDLV